MHIRKWKGNAQTINTRRAKNIEREARRQQELTRMSQSRPVYTRPTKYSETMVARI